MIIIVFFNGFDFLTKFIVKFRKYVFRHTQKIYSFNIKVVIPTSLNTLGVKTDQ